MGKRVRLLSPFLLPFFLSLFPVFLLLWEGRERQELGRERYLAEWRRRAVEKVERLRADHQFESQMNRFNHDFRRRLEAYYRRRPDHRFDGRIFAQGFQTAFPKTHQLQDASLYAFAISPQGGVELLRGPGLKSTKRSIFEKLFSALLHVNTLEAAEIKKIDRFLRGILGTLSRLELLAHHRQGLLTPVKFEGVNGFLLWDLITRDKAVIGGYFLIFPAPRNRQKLRMDCLRHTLRAVNRQDRDFHLATLLIPLESAATDTPAVLPAALAGDSAVRSLLARLRRPFPRATLVPNGKISESISGLRIWRQSFSLNFPYEAWVVSPNRSLRQAGDHTWGHFLAQFLAMLVLFGWLAVFARVLITGEMLPISMRTWFFGFFLLVGMLPVLALYMAGNLQIETAKEREIRERTTNTLDAFEEINGNTNLIFGRFVEESFSLMASSHLSTLLSRVEDRGFQEAAKLVQSFFSRSGFFEPTLFQFPAGQVTRIAPPPHRPPDPRETDIGAFYAPLFFDALRMIDPTWVRYVKAGSDSKDSIMDAIFQGGFVGGDMGFNFVQIRGNGDLIEWYDEFLFQYYDYIASGPNVQCGILLREKAWNSIVRYLFQAFWHFSRQMPANSYSVGKIVPGSYQAIFPPPESSFWRSTEARALNSGFSRCSRIQKQVTLVDSRRHTLTIVLPTTKPRGYLLGAVLSLEDIFTGATRKKTGLAIISVLLLITILLIGITFSHHLLDPLQRVEQGLKKAAAGDLSQQIGMSRDDELGNMTAKFDQMIEGLQKRQELGRYVSGTLEFELNSKEFGKGAKSSRKIVTVLVSDIRDFTTISENKRVRDVVRMLNSHLAVMTEIITRHGGVIDQFIGDAIVAVFFAQTPQESIDNSLAAALEMVTGHAALLATRRKAGEFRYDFGIGIDFGTVIVGSLSTPKRQEWSILGAPRTQAEELEGESKKGRHTRIMVSANMATVSPGFAFAPVPDSEAMELLGRQEAS